MEQALSFFQNIDLATAGVAFLAFIKFFDVIAKMTPNETDNKIADGMRKVARVLALDVPDRQK